MLFINVPGINDLSTTTRPPHCADRGRTKPNEAERSRTMPNEAERGRRTTPNEAERSRTRPNEAERSRQTTPNDSEARTKKPPNNAERRRCPRVHSAVPSQKIIKHPCSFSSWAPTPGLRWPPSPSRAPILASRALQVLPDGVRNHLGTISDQMLINDMASEPPESTNVASERLRDDECNLDLVSEPLKDNECIEDLTLEQLGSWISDPRSPNTRYPPINTHPQTI